MMILLDIEKEREFIEESRVLHNNTEPTDAMGWHISHGIDNKVRDPCFAIYETNWLPSEQVLTLPTPRAVMANPCG
jgi:hypothetical protein